MNELELRQALRGLRQDREPRRDLWPGIAARLPAAAPRRRHWLPLALAAASALLAVLVTRLPAPTDQAAPAMPVAGAPTPLLREADMMIVEYRAALAELSLAPLPPTLRPLADQLDDGARDLRDALERHPQSLDLLQQLRRTYDQRLRLSQRAALG
jgi:hypothetical protein